MKALEQAAAEKFGHDVTMIGFLYVNRLITTKEMSNMINRARINFIDDLGTAHKGGDNNE